MLHLCDVLQFVIYGFNNSPLPEKKLVGDTHQRTSHVAFQFCDKLYAIDKEPLEKILSDIAFVTNELAVDEFNKSLVLKRFAVIHITWSYHEIQNLALLVAIKCSLNPKNHPMEHLPLCAMPLNTLWICILWFLHTLSGVLSTKLMPVHLPSNTFFINKAKGTATCFSSSTKRL